MRGEGAVGAPVMDALREPTRCAAVVVCLVCVRVCIMRCDFERKSREVECRVERGGTGRWRRQPWATPAASTTKHESVLCVCVIAMESAWRGDEVCGPCGRECGAGGASRRDAGSNASMLRRRGKWKSGVTKGRLWCLGVMRLSGGAIAAQHPRRESRAEQRAERRERDHDMRAMKPNTAL